MIREIIGATVGTTLSPGKIAEKLEIAQMREQLNKIQADLDYKPIAINSFTTNVNSVYEKGAVVNEVVLNWTLSKTPTSQTINGTALDVNARSAKMTGPFTSTVKFKLVVTDERGADDEDEDTISFVSRIYYGLLADGVEINSSSIKGLNNKLQGSRGVTFNVAPTSLMRIAYAIPVSGYGTPTFKGSNGFAVDMYRLDDTIQVENDLGYVEEYYVLLSTYLQDQASTVIVT